MRQTDSMSITDAVQPRPQPGGVDGASRRRLVFALIGALLVLMASVLLLPPNVETMSIILALIAIGIPFAWLVWKQPVVALIVIVFLNASFFPSSALDIRLGFGGFDLVDLLVLGLVGMLALRKLVAGRLTIPWWPVSAPLLLFLVIAVFSALYALLLQRVSANYAFNELRPIIYYLAALATVWAVTRPAHMAVLVGVLFVIADLIVAIIIAQQFRGLRDPLIESVMSGAGRTWLLWAVDGISSGFGSVRVVPAGHVLTYTMSIVAFCSIFRPRQRLLQRAFFGAQFLFINIGLLLTYTRAQWIASAVAVTLTLAVLMIDNRRLVLSFMFVSVLTLLIALSVMGITSYGFDLTSSPSPLMARFLSIFSPDETLESSSLQDRVYENEEAVDAIVQNPLIGVGLGNSYRGASLLRPRESVGDLRFTRFIHNAYLHVAVKMGLPALAVFMWFCVAFLVGGWRVYRKLADRFWKPVMLAMLFSFIGVMLWSNTQPNFMLTESSLFAGVMVGIVMACRELSQETSMLDNAGDKQNG